MKRFRWSEKTHTSTETFMVRQRCHNKTQSYETKLMNSQEKVLLDADLNNYQY